MKSKALLILVLILAIALPAIPAFAFTEPSQGTDNATDVIIWHGDNLTISDVTIDGEVTIAGLTDSLDDAAESLLSFIIVGFIITLAFIKPGDIFHAIAAGVSIVYGLVLASNQTVAEPLWVAGVSIALIGLYFIYTIAAGAIRKARTRS